MTKTAMNNLSQQLCELCGIKPRYFIEFTRTSGCGAIAKSLSAFSYRTIRSAKNYIIEHKNETESELRIVQRYPDFEKPENFVKLLELEVDTKQTLCSKILIYISNHSSGKSAWNLFYSRKSFIECLISYIQSLDYSYKWRKHIKQAIAAEEWEY